MIREYLRESEWSTVDRMWRQGNDTHDIAQYLGVSEAAVYNGLHLIKRKAAA